MSKLKIINYFFLQFLFIRLTKNKEEVELNESIKLSIRWWSLQFFVVPFTGWSENNNYIWVTGEPIYVRISNKFIEKCELFIEKHEPKEINVFEKSKLALRNYILNNKEKVKKDLEDMRNASTDDINRTKFITRIIYKHTELFYRTHGQEIPINFVQYIHDIIDEVTNKE